MFKHTISMRASRQWQMVALRGQQDALLPWAPIDVVVEIDPPLNELIHASNEQVRKITSVLTEVELRVHCVALVVTRLREDRSFKQKIGGIKWSIDLKDLDVYPA